MTKIQYRIDVKRNGSDNIIHSFKAGDTEKEAFETFSDAKELFSESQGYTLEVFKIEITEKKLITENWKP